MTPQRQAEEYAAAIDYARAIRKGAPVDWPTYNKSIIDRWSKSALLRVKTRAWELIADGTVR